jgi:hypothetical protein
MALHFIKEKPEMGTLSDRRLFLSTDKSRVVEEGDPRAAYLFAAPGTEVAATDMAAFGLTVEGGAIALPAAVAADAPEAKMADAPENKMAEAPANKGRKRRAK